MGIALFVQLVMAMILAGGAAAASAPTAAQSTPAAAPPHPSGPARCGDGLLQAGETCTTCAQDCAPHPCAPSKRQYPVRIEFTPPVGQEISTTMLLVSYRNATLTLPGQATDSSVLARVKAAVDGASLTVNDLGYAARLVVSKVSLERGAIAEVTFDVCEGAKAPTLDDLACMVEASAGIGGPLSGATCRLGAP